jgi:hypothetical protein
VRPHGKLRSDERADSYDRDLYSIQFEDLRVPRGLFPRNSARLGHEIHHDFISNPYDVVTAYFIDGNLPNCVVGKHRQSSLDPFYVLGRGINEEIDVFRRPLQAIGDDGEATDEKVECSLSIQRGADLGEIFRPWLT